MQVAATTSHAALTASPRLSATIANATAPRSATAVHKIFACTPFELLMVFMDALPHYRKAQHTKFLPRLNLDQDKTGGIGPRSNLQTLCNRRRAGPSLDLKDYIPYLWPQDNLRLQRMDAEFQKQKRAEKAAPNAPSHSSR